LRRPTIESAHRGLQELPAGRVEQFPGTMTSARRPAPRPGSPNLLRDGAIVVLWPDGAL